MATRLLNTPCPFRRRIHSVISARVPASIAAGLRLLSNTAHGMPAPEGIAAADPVIATTALNATVEAIARRDLAQYQWTYKRFRLRPARDHAQNPYHGLR